MEFELNVYSDLRLWTQFIVIASKYIFVATFTNFLLGFITVFLCGIIHACIHTYLYNVHS